MPMTKMDDRDHNHNEQPTSHHEEQQRQLSTYIANNIGIGRRRWQHIRLCRFPNPLDDSTELIELKACLCLR